MIDHKQELFDKVSKHLLTQNKKATQPTLEGQKSPHCRYRTADGLSCAVGCLIDDKYYNPDCEGVSVPIDLENIGNNEPQECILADCLIKSLGYTPTTDDLSLLRSLQLIHDTYDADNWRDELMKLAFDEGLAFNEGSA